MLLSEILQVAATGEDIEVYVTDTNDMYHPFSELMPKEWDEYEVKHFYSIMNKSKNDSKTRVEVKEI